MAQPVVRNLDEDVKTRLRQRAAAHGRSLEAAVRAILGEAVQRLPRLDNGLGTEIVALFRGLGLDQDIPEMRTA
jgi:antitoxin FitA